MTGAESTAGLRRRRAARPVGLLVCAVALLFGLTLGRPPVNREQELRVALTARDMAQGGSWMVPHYRGQIRLQKPPLMYWLVAAAYRVTGIVNSPRLARLPTAAFGIGLIALIYAGGARWVGRRRAAAGAFVAASSFLFMRHSMLGETDIPLAFFTALAVFLGAGAMRRGRSPAGWLGCGLAAGLGFMTKGPAALAIPLGTLALAAFLAPSARRRCSRLRALWALPVFAAVAAPWYAWILFSDSVAAAGGQAVHKEIGALMGDTAHPGPVVFYLYVLPLMLMPWGLMLFPAVPMLIRHARRREGVRLLAIWFAVALVSLSAVSSKQMHYATLLLVPASLAAGCFLVAGLRPFRTWRTRLVRGYAGALAGLAAAGGLALAAAPWIRPEFPRVPCAAAGAALAAAGLFGATAAARRRPRTGAVLGGIFAVAAVAQAAYLGALMPAVDPHAPMPEFAAEVAARTAPGARVVHLGDDGGALDFYLGRTPDASPGFEAAWAATRPGGTIAVIASPKRKVYPAVPPAPPAFDRTKGDLRYAIFAR